MKLSDIVAYLNQLDTISVKSTASSAVYELEKINHIVQNSKVQIPGAVDMLTSNYNDMKLVLDGYRENLKKLRADVFDLVTQQEPEYFANSQDLYQAMRHDTPEHILQRTASINPDTLLFLRKKLQGSHCDWRYPGMIIRPAHSPWVEDLVALDPLYFVDTHEDLLTPVVSKFTPEYQRRLRRYVIDEYGDAPAFWNLPQRQFGFVYSMGYFNFKPWEIIKQYLSEIFELLREGGTFLFSFNDCDQWRAVGLVEHHFCCYTPGRLIREYAVSLGYEIEFDHDVDSAATWLGLRRPGTITSIRGGQALAMVLRIQKPTPEPEPESVIETLPEVIDMSIQARYNRLDLGELIELANMLSVDISNDKNKGMFNIKKVRRTVRQYLEEHNWPEKQLKRLFKRKPK
jgi:SAM-dependent methyltransferase